MKILVLRFSSLGDIIMATAMVRCLREAHPTAQIDMVVREDFFDLIKDNPHLNQKMGLSRIEGWRGLFELAKTLRSERYDYVYDAHRSLRTRLLMPFIFPQRAAYFNKQYLRRALALTFKLRILDKKRMLERYVEPLKKWGVTYDGKGPELFLSDATRTKALAKFGVNREKPWIGIIPSAQWPGKRWPLPYFRNVIERLIAETNASLIIFGGPGDSFCGDLVRGLPADRVMNTQGQLGIGESAALIERCQLVVANDTGLMHIADSLNIPSVLMLGPTSAESGCLPFHPQARILEEDLWCRPCSKNGQAPCIRRKRFCLTNISPGRVFDATLALLRSKVSPV